MGLVRNKVYESVYVNASDDATFALTDYCAGTANSATAIITSGWIIFI